MLGELCGNVLGRALLLTGSGLAETDRSWPWSSSESGTQRARALAAGWCVARPRCVSGCRVP